MRIDDNAETFVQFILRESEIQIGKIQSDLVKFLICHFPVQRIRGCEKVLVQVKIVHKITGDPQTVV